MLGLSQTHRPFRGALVKKAADLAAQNFTVDYTVLAWDTETYDTDAIHDNATNNSRLTVPAGVTRVRLSACVRVANIDPLKYIVLEIRKNGLASYDGSTSEWQINDSTAANLGVNGPVLTVTAGDYFEVFILVQTDISVDIVAARSWFAMEIVE